MLNFYADIYKLIFYNTFVSKINIKIPIKMRNLTNKFIKRIGILLLLLCFLSVNKANAQFLDRLKKTVQKTVEDAVDRKVEEKTKKTTEDAIDSIFDGGKKKSDKKKTKVQEKQKTTEELNPTYTDEEEMEAPDFFKNMGNMEKAEYETSYSFSVTVTMKVENFQDGKEMLEEGMQKDMEMKQSFGKNAIAFYVENEKKKMLSVIDLKNESMLMLSEEDKSGSAIPLSFLDKFGSEDDDDNENYEIKKTGRSRKIKGYTCYEYVIADNNFKQEVWLAPSLNFLNESYVKELSKMSKRNKNQKNLYKALKGNEGFPIEIILYLDNKKTSRITVTDINKKQKNIKISDYKMMN